MVRGILIPPFVFSVFTLIFVLFYLSCTSIAINTNGHVCLLPPKNPFLFVANTADLVTCGIKNFGLVNHAIHNHHYSGIKNFGRDLSIMQIHNHHYREKVEGWRIPPKYSF